ncbi:outer membrane protein assembly factor BamB family protein [Micromonospora inositola]|uniref:outer membrane protein assembly factor BamB family protein n=1 Tax=Micromonospora inositola TaxID=47865 RepID=UPI001E3879B3|nr:PQQ-binding-like beta-propeller repeat protein [Micromonospora inositola]
MAVAVSPVIELGELRHGDETEPPPDPRRPPSRSARVAALLCAALLVLAGSAPAPGRRPSVAVPAPQGAGFLVLADRLVVADGPGTVGRAGRLVTGHRLPGGEPLWRFVLPTGDHALGLTTVAGAVLVISSPAGAGDPASTLLDPDTGAVRWRQPGYPVRTESGGVLFETPRADGTGTVRAVDPVSGRSRWSLPLPGNGLAYEVGDRGVTRVVLVTAAGRVEVHDAGSGALLRAGRVPPAADGVSYRVTQVVGDLLLLDGAPGTVTAYGLDRLDRRWSMPVGPSAETWFADCAGSICLRDRGLGVRAVDPATGRLLWTDDRWLGIDPVDGRLLASAPAVGLEMDLSVVDPRTGGTLARLGRWRLSGGARYEPALLGLRRLGEDRTLVAELDVPAGQARIRAVLPGSWDDCAAAAAALVCLRPSGGLVVWPDGR